MSSVSGLSEEHRLRARYLTKQAAMLGYSNRDSIHYTQGALRWYGIAHDLKAYRGEYPTYADCSAYATWCIWNGLDHYGVRDTVNDANWAYGYTGTMLENGKVVQHFDNLLAGDCVLYGIPGTTGRHVAIFVDAPAGIVVSHGSEGGPYLVKYDYRDDVIEFRRYI